MADQKEKKLEAFLSHVTKTFQEGAVPTLTNAFVSGMKKDSKELLITAEWKQTNYSAGNTNLFSTVYKYNGCSEKESLEKLNGFPVQRQSVALQSVSPSLKLNAVIKKQENPISKKEEFVLEIWSSAQMKVITAINLSAVDKHGSVHADVVFGSLSWSGDESKLVYVAEMKKPKAIGFFDPGERKETDIVGEKYDYEESWGEQLTEVTNTVMCIVDIQSCTLDVVSDIPNHICPAQPQWGSGETLIFEGIHKVPFRLGRIYCENRVSGIYCKVIDGYLKELTSTSTKQTNFCPRLSNCKTKIAFLHRDLSESGDSHRGSEVLMVYDFAQNKLEKVYDSSIFDNMIVPLFCHFLPSKCWLNNNNHVALSNVINGRNYTCIIDTSSSTITKMYSSTSVYGTFSNIVISSLMNVNSKAASLQISTLTKLVAEEHVINETVDLGSLTDDNGIVSYYLMPEVAAFENAKYPLIIWPHGGPHSVLTGAYSMYAKVLCELGFAVLWVNYRGSTGFTDTSLKSLPGKIGTQDVQDVQNFAQKFLEMQEEKIDKTNIFVFGGSHGGFLAAHLIGQYPDFYRAACLRNPVIEVASMSVTTDIPDWTYYEAGVPYYQSLLPSAEVYKTMLEKSPIIHLKNVKAPVLLCIGEKDARVPPSQGKLYYNLLKANNKVVKMLLYPNDCHPLTTVETEGDAFMNLCKWFYVHRNTEQK